MARTNYAIYKKEEKVESDFVESNFDDFDKNKFTCCFCGVKVGFTKGISTTGPYFKNWRNIPHTSACLLIKNIQVYLATKEDKDYKLKASEELILSTILPRAQRLFIEDKKSFKFKRVINHLQSKRTQLFMSAINQLNNHDLECLNVVTEDNEILKLKDLILSQDAIVDKLEKEEETSFIRVLKAVVSRVEKVGKNYKVIMTKGERYQNKKDFYLFVPQSYVEKNEKHLEKLPGTLIYCYGIVEKNEFGCKMDLYSFYHQIAIHRKFT
ncbi:hypothetical protein [Myroides odoratimimus]|uniref:hypothetical protein n=1 Tax=Myroides odoratimimus TaxID=76832 RepID=UPI002578107E|nr:hypothetical protein [Myroides odoratimimus]MDM1086713.1 hypothetical protein [Myroides odoratimimus]